MVAIVERVAVKPWEITAQNGDHFEIKPGKSYTTTKSVYDDGRVTVFSRFWVKVPVDVFGTVDQTQKCPHCHKTFLSTSLGEGVE